MTTEPVVHIDFGTTFDSGRGEYSVTTIVTLRFSRCGKAANFADAELAIAQAKQELQQKVKAYVQCDVGI